MGFDEVLKAVLENGVIAGLLVVSLWWFAKMAAKREDLMANRIENLENRLITLLEITTSHIGQSNGVIEKNTEAIDRMRILIEDHIIKHGQRP